MQINRENYESWMIDYIEGNLSAVQAEQLRHFLTLHPELQAELDAFELTKLQPDLTVIFENKDILKKQEAGKVLSLSNWKNYAIGIAASLMLFTGIWFFTSNNSVTNGIAYTSDQLEKPAFAFKHKPAINPVHTVNQTVVTDKSLYAVKANTGINNNNTEHQEQAPEEDYAANKKYQHLIDVMMATDAVEYASIDTIDYIKLRGKIERDVNDAYINYVFANYVHINDNASEKMSIIDKYNNTVAFAESIGSLLGIGQDQDNASKQQDNIRETHIKVFDIEYYNRKKTNK
jgi:hypothetical protein